MNLKKSLTLLALGAFSASVAACSTPATQNLDSNSSDPNISALSVDKYSGLKSGDVIPGEFIVKFKKGSKQTNAFGNSTVKPLGGNTSDIVLVTSSTPNSNAISSNANVLWSEPNRVIRTPKTFDARPADPIESAIRADLDTPNDPMFGQQYAHKISNSIAGWAAAKGKVQDTIIAVTDTGADVTHPDLKDKAVAGYSAYPGDPETKDLQGHGTHCFGIAAAMGNNAIGVAGVAMFPNIRVQPVKVLNSQGSGTYAAVADGMLWAATHGAKVISMSLGGPSSSKAMEDAVATAVKNDVLVIVAMGNAGTDDMSYPAGIIGVMAVGATDSADKIAGFSQFGKHISVAAPGVNILSTFPQYKNGIGQMNYGSISGTSMATPFVAGLAGLIRSTNPSLTAAQTRSIIEKSADDLGDKGFDVHYGWGRVNVGKALSSSLRLKK
ncbi:MAG: S8 family serine peptidase [Candidatus Sericytochromatia bacterium]|nr:S8 family serine peptidase [Candidatus Sericytochromatia bacterium]